MNQTAHTADDDLKAHWNAFCDADFFEGCFDFSERMEAAGLIELIPVAREALEDAFAYERGIEPGGMMWQLTPAGRSAISNRSPSKMNETAHTPTPWEAQSIDETGRERGAVSIIGSNLGGLVAAALPWPTELDDGDFRRVQANAEFIVRAVNAHDDMLAALKAVVDQADDLARSFGVDRMHETDDSVLAVCRAAISKATAPTA